MLNHHVNGVDSLLNGKAEEPNVPGQLCKRAPTLSWCGNWHQETISFWTQELSAIPWSPQGDMPRYQDRSVALAIASVCMRPRLIFLEDGRRWCRESFFHIYRRFSGVDHHPCPIGRQMSQCFLHGEGKKLLNGVGAKDAYLRPPQVIRCRTCAGTNTKTLHPVLV